MIESESHGAEISDGLFLSVADRILQNRFVFLFPVFGSHLFTRPKIKKKVHPHMFRHSFATHLLESGIDVTSVQSLLGHSRPETTLGYSHALKPKMIAIKSPLD